MAWERVMKKENNAVFSVSVSVFPLFSVFFEILSFCVCIVFLLLYSCVLYIYRRKPGACCTGAIQVENPPIKWRIHCISSLLFSSVILQTWLILWFLSFSKFWFMSFLCQNVPVPFLFCRLVPGRFCWAWPILVSFFFCWTKALFSFLYFFCNFLSVNSCPSLFVSY